MKNFWDSIVRTIVPAIVSTTLAWLVARGIEMDAEFEKELTSILILGFNGVYYVGSRLLETYVSPKFGWLLGLAAKPVYRTTPKHAEISE